MAREPAYRKGRNSRTLPPTVTRSTFTVQTGFVGPHHTEVGDLEQQLPNFSWLQNHLEGFGKADHWTPPQGFWFSRSGWGWGICISNRLPGAAASSASDLLTNAKATLSFLPKGFLTKELNSYVSTRIHILLLILTYPIPHRGRISWVCKPNLNRVWAEGQSIRHADCCAGL